MDLFYGTIIGAVTTIGIFWVVQRISRNTEVKEGGPEQPKIEPFSLAAHKMKTPIGAMRWNMELLLGGDYGEMTTEQKEILRDTYELGDRLNEFVNALVNVSVAEKGAFLIDPVPVDFKQACLKVTDELQEKISAKQQELIVESVEPLPLVLADSALLAIIFNNLISNAHRFTPEGGRIIVSIKTENKNLVFSVANSGEPIPEVDMPHLFEKLFRASNAKKYSSEGYGLGLCLTKQIIDQSGGKIIFSTTKDKYTVFTYSCPLSGMIKRQAVQRLSY